MNGILDFIPRSGQKPAAIEIAEDVASSFSEKASNLRLSMSVK